MYNKSAVRVAEKMNTIWHSEEAMIAWFKEVAFIDLDRTSRARMFVTKLIDQALAECGMNTGSILAQDRKEVAKELALVLQDFNLSTQVALNVQDGSLSFDLAKMQEDAKLIEPSYPSVEESPMAKKAKYKSGADESEKKFNGDLALLKNMKIASEMQKGVSSYRITPLGKTPALADNNNLSNMSPLAIQPYLEGGELYMFDTGQVTRHFGMIEDGAAITAKGLKFAIHSESGGDIVKKALASRYITSRLIFDPAIKHLVPRYESVLILRGEKSTALDELIQEGLVTKYVRT
jgi:hypothetical protein